MLLKKEFVKNYRLSDEYQESDGFMIIKNISNSNIKFNTFDLLTASDLFTDYTEEKRRIYLVKVILIKIKTK